MSEPYGSFLFFSRLESLPGFLTVSPRGRGHPSSFLSTPFPFTEKAPLIFAGSLLSSPHFTGKAALPSSRSPAVCAPNPSQHSDALCSHSRSLVSAFPGAVPGLHMITRVHVCTCMWPVSQWATPKDPHPVSQEVGTLLVALHCWNQL